MDGHDFVTVDDQQLKKRPKDDGFVENRHSNRLQFFPITFIASNRGRLRQTVATRDVFFKQ